MNGFPSNWCLSLEFSHTLHETKQLTETTCADKLPLGCAPNNNLVKVARNLIKHISGKREFRCKREKVEKGKQLSFLLDIDIAISANLKRIQFSVDLN